MFNQVKIRDGHDNFFTPLRLFFALMVLFGHAFVVSLRDVNAEPFLFYHYKASYTAVNLFFIASGFLVTKSMLYRQNMPEYSAARFLRIYPALIVHVLFIMFVMGPFVTNMPLDHFFADPAFWTQPFQVLSFYETNMVMPGALLTNDEQMASGALWTLRYEVLAYIGTAIVFSLGLLKYRWMIAGQFFLLVLLWYMAQMTGFYETVPATLQALMRFGLCYSLGAAIYAYRDELSFHILGIPALGVFASLFNGTIMFEILFDLWLAYIIFWAAYVKIPKLSGLTKLSDISYGLYIYHWCVLQWLFYQWPGLSTWQLIALTLPITTALAYASWHLVEKPALRHKKALGQWLSSCFRKPKAPAPVPPTPHIAE